MTNFRPKSLSPEALEAWDIAEANVKASMQRIRELATPPAHDLADAAPLLWLLWSHQGAHSPIGQPIRQYLGMGQFERMTSEQIQAAEQYRYLMSEPTTQVNSSASHIVVPPQNCRQRLKSEGKFYPKSSCEVCGSILTNSTSSMLQKCDAALAMEASQQLGPPASSLVERVLQKVLDTPSPAPLSISPNQIRAAILEIAAWLRVESEDHFGNGLHWSLRLEREATNE